MPCLHSLVYYCVLWLSLLDPNKWARQMMTADLVCNLRLLSSELSIISPHYEIQNWRWLCPSVVLFSLWYLLLKLPHGIFDAVLLIKKNIFLIVHNLATNCMKFYRLGIYLISTQRLFKCSWNLMLETHYYTLP